MKKEIEVNITLVQKDKYNWQEASKVGDSEIKYHASDADRRKELEGKTFKSDLLFSLAMGSSTRMAEYIARTVTGRSDIVIEKVIPQSEIRSMGHSVRLDAIAYTTDGEIINYEMQRRRYPDMGRRLRMYESAMNLSFLARGEDYGDLPEVITIVLYDYDVYSRGKAMYTSYWRDDEGNITDNSAVRYEVNLRYKGKEDIGELMNIIHDFDCDRFEEMYSETLRDEMESIKGEEGIMGYGGDIDEYINEGKEIGLKKGREEGIQEGIKKGKENAIRVMLKNKISTLSEIANAFDMSITEVEAIANSL